MIQLVKILFNGLVLFMGLFSCEKGAEQLNKDVLLNEKNEISIEIVGSDTLIFYKENNYDLCDLKYDLFWEMEISSLKNTNNRLNNKAQLFIQTSVKMKEVYELIDMLQSIGFSRVSYSIKNNENRKIGYRIPVNINFEELVELGCVLEYDPNQYLKGQRLLPPLLTEHDLPKRFILVVDSTGTYSVDDKAFTIQEYKMFIYHQFKYWKHKIIGLKIDEDLSFENYFDLLKILYDTIDQHREEEALLMYEKSFSDLDKENQRCIRKLFPRNIIDFKIKDSQSRGCGGMINWD